MLLIITHTLRIKCIFRGCLQRQDCRSNVVLIAFGRQWSSMRPRRRTHQAGTLRVMLVCREMRKVTNVARL